MADNKITTKQVGEYNSELAESLNKLVALLGDDHASLSESDIKQMLQSPNTTLFVALADGKIVGMVTLIVYRIPFVKKAIIEDLVVLSEYRQKGIGKLLIQSAIDKGRVEEVAYVDMTSRPEREAANIFYARFGFEKRDTNVYRLKL